MRAQSKRRRARDTRVVDQHFVGVVEGAVVAREFEKVKPRKCGRSESAASRMASGNLTNFRASAISAAVSSGVARKLQCRGHRDSRRLCGRSNGCARRRRGGKARCCRRGSASCPTRRRSCCCGSAKDPRIAPRRCRRLRRSRGVPAPADSAFFSATIAYARSTASSSSAFSLIISPLRVFSALPSSPVTAPKRTWCSSGTR